jgi:hypothetical protein
MATPLPIGLKGSQFDVSSVFTPTGPGPTIAGLSDGDVVVSWEDGANAEVQLFDSNGNALSAETTVALSSSPSEALLDENVVALADGNFVVSWDDQVGAAVTVKAQIFGPNLNKIGSIITVDTPLPPGDSLSLGDVFATPDGGFAYAMFENNPDFESFEWTQAFDAVGTPVGVQVLTGPAISAFWAATALTNGDFASLIDNPVGFRVYTPSGQEVVGDTGISETINGGDIAALPNGRFVTVYSASAGGGNFDIVAQIFNSDGTEFTGNIPVNGGALNASPGGNPHVSVMPDGRFIVSWYNTGGSFFNNLTEVRVFNPNGTPASNIFAIPSSAEDGNQLNDVTALSNTSFAVDWITGSSLAGQVMSIQAPPNVPDNFVGYGTSDILLQNGGNLTDWLMSNGSFSSSNAITTGLPAGWNVVGTGDFNGDGTSDILLQNGSSVTDWLMSNGSFSSSHAITTGLPAGWNVVGTGDFNGDGTSDILLKNGGSLTDFILNNGALSGSKTITTGLPAGWNVVGTGDFNGDGTTDILLQNGGSLTDWLLNNGSLSSSHAITTGLPPGWNVVGTGDFNGDGTTDILLQNGSSLTDWLVSNGSFSSSHGITTGLPAGWNVVGTGDYNDDGTTDILLQNGGSVTDWLINNGSFSSSNSLTTNLPPGWNALHV